MRIVVAVFEDEEDADRAQEAAIQAGAVASRQEEIPQVGTRTIPERLDALVRAWSLPILRR